MSRKERARVTIMAGVKELRLTLVQAAELMAVCYRQGKRIWRRYQDDGDAGLGHRLRGRPSARRKPPALRAQVLAKYEEERYADFGPTLMAEHLLKEKVVVDHETVRRWLLASGKRTVRRRKQTHRQWRERKPCLGAMVQLDGSHHDWFEGRRAPCVLMVMVDDATNRMRARFFEEETTHASYDVLEGWVRKHGLMDSLYVDRDSIYRCEGPPSIAQQLAGKQPQTQFGRAMEQLGIKLILANSPQAKGRVERMNGVLQDRLVKELRLAGSSDIESANRFLEGKYLQAFHRRFGREAASPVDVHRADPCVKRFGFEAVGVAFAFLGAFVGLSLENVVAFHTHGLVDKNTQSLGQAVRAVLVKYLQNVVQNFRIVLVGHAFLVVGCVCRHPNRRPTWPALHHLFRAACSPCGDGCARLATLAFAPPPPQGEHGMKDIQKPPTA